MKTDRYCRWARHRLPLLAGGDLGVDERRKLERHLIGCSDCRDRRDASTGALSALRLLAGPSPATIDVPSLWPSLARQIRESRHVVPRPSWWDLGAFRPWLAATMATGLGAVLAASMARAPSTDSRATTTPTASPQTVSDVTTTGRVASQAPAPRRMILPDGPLLGAASAPLKPIEPPSLRFRFDYDLDHGTPMSRGNLDPQRTY